MGMFEELKAYVTSATESPVDADAEYTRHRAQAQFDHSPTGQEIRKISRAEAMKPTETGTLPTGDVDLQTGKAPGEHPTITPDMQQQAVQDKETGRQAKLQASFDNAPAQPPVGLDAILAGLDYPASKVRGAIAKHISAKTGAKVTEANLTEYIAKSTAPGDPSGQVVNQLLTGLVTDPVNYLPVIGLPTSAYKAVGQAAVKGVKAVADVSKGAGVDLASETGAISTRLLTGNTFYSPTQRVIEAKVPNSATPEQVQKTLANSGISLDEAKWMDLDGFMAGKKTVTKPELLDYIKSHQVEVKEVELSKGDPSSLKMTEETDHDWQFESSTGERYAISKKRAATQEEALALVQPSAVRDHTQFGGPNTTLPGGTNYRELLLTLPPENIAPTRKAYQLRDAQGTPYAQGDEVSAQRWRSEGKEVFETEELDERAAGMAGQFISTHFSQPNILVHVRTNDRVDVEGKRVLFIEEVQSDWHQKGKREGYTSDSKVAYVVKKDGQFYALKDSKESADSVAKEISGTVHEQPAQPGDFKGAVPDAPFKKTWHELALKRVLRLAAEEGYERIAWTTGAQQAERYDLSKQVRNIEYLQNTDGSYNLEAVLLDGNTHTFGDIPESQLADHVGKDVAERILAGKGAVVEDAPDGVRSLSGLDLKVGGEGMKGFYDDMLPRFVNKYAKKWGGKVEQTEIGIAQDPSNKGHGVYEGDAMPRATVHSLTFTPEMTNAVINNPQSLMGGIFQTVDEHLKTLPRMMLDKLRTDETGSASVTASLALTRMILGAVVGAKVGDEENSIRNAIIGAGLGAVMSPKAIAAILSKVKGVKGGAKPLESWADQAAQATTETASIPPQDAPGQAMVLPLEHFQQSYQQRVESASRLKPGETQRHDPEVVADSLLDLSYGVITKEKIANFYPGTTLNDNQLMAAAEAGSQSGKQLLELAVTGDDVTFAEALWTHGNVFDPKFVALDQEAGRAVRILGNQAPVDVQGKREFLEKIREIASGITPESNLNLLREKIKALETPEQLAVFSKNIVKPGLIDAWMSLWVNSLLSGPHTHAANILGNGATLGWTIGERQIAGMMGGAVRPGEAVAMVQGVTESFGDALKAFGKAWKQNEPVSTGTKVEQRPRVSFDQKMLTGIPGQALDYLSAAFEMAGGRTLMATDEFFKAISFRAELRAGALRKAYEEVNAGGLTGKAARAKIHELSEQYVTDIPADIKKQSEQFAAYVTFTKELGETGKWIQEGAAKHAAVKLVIPFVRAPLNIFKFANERTPLAFLTKSLYADIRAGGARAELATAKLATGTMIAMLGTAWAANGIITGGGPNARKFKEVVDSAKEDGWQPYSINVTALKRQALGKDPSWQRGDKLISYNRVEPLGMLLGLYANYTEIISNAETDDHEELANALLMATVKTMASKTFIKGLSQTALAFAYPDEFLGDTVTRQGVGFVPILGSSLSRQVARTVDPVLRDAEGFVEELMKNTPGLSSKLPPLLHTITGEPVFGEGGWGPDLISPLRLSTFKDDPVLNEIAANKVNLTKHSGIIHGVELNTVEKVNIQRIITKDVKEGGRNLHDALAHLMESNAYKKGSDGPDGRKSMLIKSMFSAFKQMGELKYLKQNPDVMQMVKDQYKAKAARMKDVQPPPSDDAVDASHLDLSIAGY